ncbi:teichoic acid D-Ala incorporation-associated protein DltX [Ornithinibacillus xuwenensis]|uniref:Teichoic acid D-Ala incorporation-associated protein DltX n=1 Tax=Ornithinibacillus xuwenensis TaxID=3144668 RepID=A0ABU9XF39_9BACI
MKKLKTLYSKNGVRFALHTSFYLAILITLFLMYGFHTANTGNYIYNDF